MADAIEPNERFTAAPQATIEQAGFRVAWPTGGLPVALDVAAATVLDCFDDPLSVEELTEDLVAAVGLDRETASHSALTLTTSLRDTGHLIPEGLQPMPAANLSYPPAPSPCLLGRISFGGADSFSLAFGPVGLRAVSESPALRPLVTDRLGWEVGNRPYRMGVLLGRPAADATVGKGFWIVYESGSVVLRRTVSEDDAAAAAAFHLVAIEAAVESPLLPLRMKIVLLPSGGVLLAGADAVYTVPGHDRGLARRGCTVLPTTVAVIDPATRELVLPPQDLDPLVPVGRRPIERIALPTRGDRPVDDVSTLLALARTVIRDPHRDLQAVLDQLVTLTSGDPPLVELMKSVEIEALVAEAGPAQGS